MRSIAPLGYWSVQLARVVVLLIVIWLIALGSGYVTLGGPLAGLIFIVAGLYLWALSRYGWTRYYTGAPLNSDVAFPENDGS